MDKIELAFSPSCERNKDPILAVLRQYLSGDKTVLELGSGSGQHAEYFAQHLPDLCWQTADQQCFLEPLAARVAQASLANLRAPFRLDVNDASWLVNANAKVCCYDAVFTANTLHIMDADSVENFFKGLPCHTHSDALVLIYGPFKYAGEFTSESNAEFDRSLRSRGEGSAIRDSEWINLLAEQAGFALQADIAMPANNQCLVYQRHR